MFFNGEVPFTVRMCAVLFKRAPLSRSQENGSFLVWNWDKSKFNWVYASRGKLPSHEHRPIVSAACAPAPAGAAAAAGLLFWVEKVRGPGRLASLSNVPAVRVLCCSLQALTEPKLPEVSKTGVAKTLPYYTESSTNSSSAHDDDGGASVRLMVAQRGAYIVPVDGSLPLYYYSYSSGTLVRVHRPHSTSYASRVVEGAAGGCGCLVAPTFSQ